MIRTVRDGLIAEHLGVEVAMVTEKIAATGSLIASIESLRGTGRTLRDYETPDLLEVEKWLADHAVLDPTSTDMFEPLSKGGLLRRRGRFLRKRLRGTAP